MIILKAVCGVIQLYYIILKGLSGIDKGSPGGEGVNLPTMYPNFPSSVEVPPLFSRHFMISLYFQLSNTGK